MKTIYNVDDLAINGAEPMFDEKLCVGTPNVGNREEYFGKMNEIFDANWLTNNGDKVKELERKLCEYLGVKNTILVNNATIGLEIASKAIGMTGEVIVPSFTFIATAHILQWQGIKPVFIDVDLDTNTMDVARIEELITEKTTGIIPVHLWGTPCNIEAIEKIAKKHNLKLLFDAAHAFGCSYNGKMIGNFGDCEVFSFHATKIFNTFEGGAITTNDDKLAEKIRLMINFGFKGYDNVVSLGLNGKMCESNAAMGLVNLEKLDEFIEKSKNNYKVYLSRLSEVDGITVHQHNENEKCNYHYIVVKIDAEKFGINRDQLCDILHAENVLARKYFYPGCHRMEPYNSIYVGAELRLENTEELCKSVLALPNSSRFNEKQINKVCDIIASVNKMYKK